MKFLAVFATSVGSANVEVEIPSGKPNLELIREIELQAAKKSGQSAAVLINLIELAG